ncbi:Homeodomain-like protein [Xylariomycetidae sp. FL0641]|nr:Homeodomain-like protein [Xylariomycetidae sp. FL0641]
MDPKYDPPPPSHHTDHKRGPWSPREDDFLMHLVSSQGPLNWVKISQQLGSRTPKQCRERYHQNLKPSLNHEPISADEGAVIEKLVSQIGKRWAEIARRLHNRSDNAVKNWWNGSMNRRRRMVRRRATTSSSEAYYDDADAPAASSSYAHAHYQHPTHHREHPPAHYQEYHQERHPLHCPESQYPQERHQDYHQERHQEYHQERHPLHYPEREYPQEYQQGRHPVHYPAERHPMPGAEPHQARSRVPTQLRLEILPSHQAYRPLSPVSAQHTRPYGRLQSGLPSPATTSPGARSYDGTPSLFSDSGSQYPTSPITYAATGSPVALPPLRLPEVESPTTPSFRPAPRLPIVKQDHERVRLPSIRSLDKYQYPTAPSSPSGLMLQQPLPAPESYDYRTREERRSRLSMSNLVD